MDDQKFSVARLEDPTSGYSTKRNKGPFVSLGDRVVSSFMFDKHSYLICL